MINKLTLVKEKKTKLSTSQKSVDLCKLQLKSRGMNSEQIDLLESHLKVIINKVFDNLENE